MRAFSYLKNLARKNRVVSELVGRRQARALERQYREDRQRYRNGLIEPTHHAQKLASKWTPRRVIPRAPDARIALVSMETWEARSLIPPVLDEFDAAHIPIIDTMDRAVYDLQQADVLERYQKVNNERPVDMALVYATNAQIAGDTLRRIAESGALVALMCLDDKHAFRDRKPSRRWPAGQLPLVGTAHVHLSSSRECLRWYDEHGASAFYWPEAANTHFGADLSVSQDIEVSFVGQKYGYRGRLVAELRREGIAVTCFGRGWENPPIAEEEMFSVYARSKINLGLGYVGTSRELTSLKGRDFDVPGSGNFYLTTYDSELAECFRVGEEIACYRNDLDCPELVRYYLERPQKRKAIASAGRARVLREHTWPRRIEKLLRTVGALSGETGNDRAGTSAVGTGSVAV